MIRLVDHLTKREPALDESLMSFVIMNSQGLLIKYDQDYIGAMAITVEGDTIYLSLYFLKQIEFDRMHRSLCYITEAMIQSYHCHKIIVIDPVQDNIPALQSCMYFANGKEYMRVVEPLRYEMPDQAFDKEGYLIHQGLLQNVSFGFFNTKDKGCGWISAYNLLKMFGYEQTMAETRDDLERMSAFGEIMGQPVPTMYLYLKKKGLPIRMAIGSDEKIATIMTSSKFGILAYTHKKGAHYTTYRNIGNARVHFYNAIYGKAFHKVTPKSFLHEHSLIRHSILLYID